MLVFNLKKEWFEKIKSGKKTHEYRVLKSYWVKRLWALFATYPCPYCECEFICGYASKNDKSKRLKAKIKNVTIISGLKSDLKVNSPVFDIEFELINEVQK